MCDECSFRLVEFPIYGLGRVGVAMPDINIDTDVPPTTTFTRRLNRKFYELTDHLGNVRAVLGDRKRTASPGTGPYFGEIRSYSHVYPFGMPQPGRVWDSLSDYRYGFNGMETDGEVKEGSGKHYTSYFRQYDPRLGRWWSHDPVAQIGESPYAAMFNNPIGFSDPFGANPEGDQGEDVDNPLDPGTSFEDPQNWYRDANGDVWQRLSNGSWQRTASITISDFQRENPNLPSLVTTDRVALESYLETQYPDRVARNMVRQTLSSFQIEQILFDLRYGSAMENLRTYGFAGSTETLGPENFYQDAYTYPGKPRPGDGYIPVLSEIADGIVETYTKAVTGKDLEGYPVTVNEQSEAQQDLAMPSPSGRGTSSARRLSKGRKVRARVPGGGLMVHEARPGAHGLLKHVGMNVADLVRRLAREPHLHYASSFHSLGHAESSIARVLEENDAVIQNWLRNTTRQQPIETIESTFARSVGIKVDRATHSVEETYRVQVVLRRDEGMDIGYRVHTFFLWGR